MLDNNQKRAVIELAKSAGEKIMAIYAQDFDVDYKDDSSPLTQADLASHHCIVDGLRELTPDIPVLSEESSEVEKRNRMSWYEFAQKILGQTEKSVPDIKVKSILPIKSNEYKTNATRPKNSVLISKRIKLLGKL